MKDNPDRPVPPAEINGSAAPEGEARPEESRAARVKAEVKEWVRSLVIALLIALFITQVVIVNARVPSESMMDTIQAGDRLIGFRLAYLFSEPERGDIIIFRFPDDEKVLYIKRVIGLPGDVVEIREGYVYLNGAAVPLEEPYIKGPPAGDFGPYTVPADSYFVLGDNRHSSWDARYWTNTYVHSDKILGKAVCRVFPHPAVLQ